jgi:hypothetical protein
MTVKHLGRHCRDISQDFLVITHHSWPFDRIDLVGNLIRGKVSL